MGERKQKIKHSSIGGEALIEGIMMRGKNNISIAIRKSDGDIMVEKRPLKTLSKRYKIFKLPVLRGAVGIFETMILGVRALMYSAEFYELEEEEQPSKFDRFLEKIFGDKLQDVAIYFSVVLAIGMGVGLFILLPNLVASFLNFNKNTASGVIYYNLFEGFIRVTLFLLYIVMVSRLKDVKRVFEYHGAEHKTIHCLEHEENLEVENVKKYTTRHPRCGTAFLFVVMIMSILFFSFVGWYSIIVNIVLRLLLIPVIAGISYEIIKLAGKSDSKWVQIVSSPGLALQRFTTSEPDGKQIEVAIAALKEVIDEDSGTSTKDSPCENDENDENNGNDENEGNSDINEEKTKS